MISKNCLCPVFFSVLFVISMVAMVYRVYQQELFLLCVGVGRTSMEYHSPGDTIHAWLVGSGKAPSVIATHTYTVWITHGHRIRTRKIPLVG